MRLELCLLNIGGHPAQEWPVTVIDQAQYQAEISLKALQSSYPAYVYLEQSRPYAMLHVWTVPTLPVHAAPVSVAGT